MPSIRLRLSVLPSGEALTALGRMAVIMGDDTKPRPTRRRTIRAGQPNSPPRRPMPVDLDVAVVTLADVMALSLELGESEHARTAHAASDINDALAEALHIAVTEPSGAASSHARWCTAVGTSARDLSASLMSNSPGDGYLPFDATSFSSQGCLAKATSTRTRSCEVCLRAPSLLNGR